MGGVWSAKSNQTGQEDERKRRMGRVCSNKGSASEESDTALTDAPTVSEALLHLRQEEIQAIWLWLRELFPDLAEEILIQLDAVSLSRVECSCRVFQQRLDQQQISLPQACARRMVQSGTARPFVPSSSMSWTVALDKTAWVSAE